jgi:signal transduction histidine kinase
MIRVVTASMSIGVIASGFLGHYHLDKLQSFSHALLDLLSKNLASPGTVGTGLIEMPTELLVAFQTTIESQLRDVKDQQTRELQNKIAIEKEEIAVQVAHDIRSPLTALNDLLKANDQNLLPETRKLLSMNLQRINDVANDLLFVHRKKRDQTSIETEPAATNYSSATHLYELLEQCFGEKFTTYSNRPEVQIIWEGQPKSYGIHARVNSSDISRAISNLVDNSVEAIKSSLKVTLTLEQVSGTAVIHIADNGKGIPPEYLTELGTKGFTLGKKSGSGLGVNQARKALENAGGSLEFNSMVGSGTIATLILPLVDPPAWFAQSLAIAPGQTIVILDDDELIHQSWKIRLSALGVPKNCVRHFSKAKDFLELSKDELFGTIFLVDYHLKEESLTGLDCIEALQIEKNSILVTGQYDDVSVVQRCRSVGVKLLAKTYLRLIPIIMEKEKDPARNKQTEYPNYDAVLIDDDVCVRSTWSYFAEQAGKNLLTLADAKAFHNPSTRIRKDTPIYIDSNLSDSLSGESFAKEIYDLGFEEIYLSTSSPKESFPVMPWIKDIKDKSTPW